jgi:hypothetical protein
VAALKESAEMLLNFIPESHQARAADAAIKGARIGFMWNADVSVCDPRTKSRG